jgi:hypothetical protein
LSLEVNDQSLGQFLAFWRPISPPTPDELEAWRARDEAARTDILSLADPELVVYEAAWTSQEIEVEETRRSLNDRSNLLIAISAVFAALGTLATNALDEVGPVAVAVFGLAAIPLVWCAIATLYLAIRTVQVGTWTRSELQPTKSTARKLRREVAADRYVAVLRNRETLRLRVGYLRDAQTFALWALVALAMLAVVALAIIAIRESSRYPGGAPVPNPTASATPTSTTSPSPTPRKSPSPTPSKSPSPPPSKSPSPTPTLSGVPTQTASAR